MSSDATYQTLASLTWLQKTLLKRFFRGFGATQTPYFSISKTPSRLLRARQALQSVIRG
jgi:hypothetical protein